VETGAMNAASGEVMKRCPECGAVYPEVAQRCWLCHASLVTDDEIVLAESVSEPPKFVGSSSSFSLASLFAVLTLVAVGLGVASLQPGLGIAYGVIVLPALLATVIRVQKQKAQQRAVSFGEKIVTFIVSIGVVVGLFALSVAALVALCFVVVAGSGMRF
jgi:hypothetical protein